MERINLNYLPNPDLIKRLYKKYYLEDKQENFTSSYWKLYGQKYDVRINEGDGTLSMSGVGEGELGDTKTKNLLTKLLNYLCIFTYLVRLKNKRGILNLFTPSFKICKSMGFYFSYNCFRQICSLALILKNMSDGMKARKKTFLMVGDGYGFLSSLIKSIFPNSTIVLVDIGRILTIQSIYCQKTHPQCLHFGVDENSNLKTADFLYCPPGHLEKFNILNYDIVINIASMQEMDYQIIERYFHYFRQYCNAENLFYCCNRESKKLPDEKVVEFQKYPWSKKDKYLIDERCPWQKYFLSIHHTSHGPRPFGFRIPLINYVKGPVRHRLTILSTLR